MNMAVMDEFKAEREYLKKHGTRQEKLAYFWDYYKWHTIIGVIAVIIVISSVYNALTAKDVVLNGILLNSSSSLEDEKKEIFISEFLTQQQIDTKKNEIILNTSLYYTSDSEKNENYSTGELTYTASQILMVQVAAGELDFITAERSTLVSLAYAEYFADLTTILSEEQIAAYQPYFYYIDQAVVDKMNEDTDLDSTEKITFPASDHPETMEKPIPVMIDISKCEMTNIFYPYMKEADPIVVGFTVNSEHTELATKFLDYLINKPN